MPYKNYMLGNITYSPKIKQPTKLLWGYVFLDGNNRFGYKGHVSFSFTYHYLSGLYLEKHEETAPKNLVNQAKLWLETGNNPLDMLVYGTDFQHKVWKELLSIPKGKTVTYQDIAEQISKPKATRAVGTAIGKNPISLIIPCHRVINKTGNKTSYLWGAKTKLKLLDFESQTQNIFH